MAPAFPRSRADWLSRAFWLGLMAMHVAPVAVTLGRVGGPAGWDALAKAVLLVGLLAFFATKVMGVRYLPQRCRWTAILAFVVICGLVHREARQGIGPEAAQPVILLVAGAAATAAAVRLHRVWARVKGSGSGSDGLPAALLSAGRWRRQLEPVVSGRLRWAWVRSSVPRGPPAL